ncbi:energy-coupling factor transporter ATP-binding protein EcfA2 [Streptosporangium becharense]|uniref:Energy-coupling factor transporter ATP-binding protein EcfA2 n=1 Tax=Streptosporangium becharense TaxID=1816182 RepID=A0A7W9ICC6_9ACTN|nr:dynamin family protein [Streptosporangium becharense]MBB2915261.1 energy-coupling factor transporter ATP-binding protein EcfA2 [Streptosporangium becharense]MBB5817910.1 energy-coupling factor transporter ATP-binding protein EcfA2 [Streptosporangium becharense]
MTAGPAELLRGLCDATAAKLAGAELRERVAQVRADLDAPLRVAVAGAVSSGKSTLVNALLGLPVAPVDAGECTFVVTQYEYGEDDGLIRIELKDGGVVHSRLLPGHRLPSELGVDVAVIRRLRVSLNLPSLRTVTIIDTPGMNTVTATNERAARSMLFGSGDEDDRAQAMIYVLRYVQKFDDTTLSEFRGLTDACGMSCVNTLAVLGQVDRRGDEDDPWPTARRLAAKGYQDLRTSVYDVVPVIGLLAETARACPLDAEEIEALSVLAGLDEDDLEDYLLDLEDFRTASDLPVPAEVRRRLVERLHRYGIATAVEAVRNGVRDAGALTAHLLERSGYASAGRAATGSVAAGIAHFARRADQLKALDALTRLRKLARTPALGADRATLDALAAQLDENKPIATALGGLRIFAAAEALGRGTLVLNEEMTEELLRLSRHDDPAEQLGLPAGAPRQEIAAAAVTASMRWRTLAMMSEGRSAGHRARDVLTVLEDIVTAALDEPDTPQAAGGEALPPLRVDPAAVEALRASPMVPADDRRALELLLSGTELATQLGAPPGSPRAEVAGYAAALGARFRTLTHRPLSLRQRRAAETLCEAYETVWSRYHQEQP